MNSLRKELRPDFATAEKLYPLVLKRLQDYEAFWDTQSEDTPEEVFEKEYKAMEQYLSELTGKDFPTLGCGNGGKAMALKLLPLIWLCLTL